MRKVLAALPLLLPLITQPIIPPSVTNTVAPFLVEQKQIIPNFDTEVLTPLRATQEAQRAAQEKARVEAEQQAETVYTPPAPVYSVPKAFIYNMESGNNPGAINASSGACGLGQALPCSKMPCSLSDYACQDNFFTGYMLERYGSWDQAYLFWISHRYW